ncbi:BMP family lipoprotein [Lentibacillus saliphilus]|uniref:BMP family lipoprotein n=1 Tax=Lentibacillus saliphilus TaxID=2737028 RepID=UPI001C307D46|nr:BMP family protein [Lentibacillus saliphilus]
MKKRFLLLVMLLTLGLIVAACGNNDDNNAADGNDNGTDTEQNGNDNASGNDEGEAGGDTDYTVAMVTDVGGVDDKSFNQSAWEGITAWGEEHGLAKGEGFDYLQSNTDADYIPNLQQLARADFDLIYGIGFKLEKGIADIAKQFPDKHFGIVDSVVDADNVVSIGFADNESSFLVGVAAALKTNTNKIGFIGGMESDIIEAFEVGFRAGAMSVNPDIDIKVQYAGGFDKADEGKLIASSMYNEDRDVIFHAAGGTGNGLFNQAKDLKKNDPDREIWAIGVDRDQHEEGKIDDHNITLTSAVKRVDNAVHEVSNMAMDGNFPGGEILKFDLKSEGVGYTTTNEDAMTQDIIDEVESWKEKIISGEIEVPSKYDGLEEYEESL